ncbi:FAD-binding protein [Trinickia sp. LjRoot230]|uniref:FAD-binding protein n=1 Tax=Trinickia sp. LjRoot230 TaxID=3342288 RepID=UPI003ECD4397
MDKSIESKTRRRILARVAVGAAVLAFDPLARVWVTDARAAASADPLPLLKGQVVTDDASLTADSTDAGYMLRRRPWAVLRPAAVDDIVAMIRYCNRYGIKVAPRGQGHCVFGQALVDSGLIVEMGTLATVHSISSAGADVDAGITWKDLLPQTVANQLTPPVLTGFLGLSVAGTLSVGGVSASSLHGGIQLNHVRQLEVVTGTGEVVACSPSSNADLFAGVLGGVGQLGIITRATVDLAPALPRARSWVLQYLDPATFFRDFQMLHTRAEFSEVMAFVVPPTSPQIVTQTLPPQLLPALGPLAASVSLGLGALGPLLGAASTLLSSLKGLWIYQINLTQYYDPSAPPNAPNLLRGTSDFLPLRYEFDQTYLDYMLRIDVLIDYLKDLGLWYNVPHPWLDTFLPPEVTESFVTQTVRNLSFDDVGVGGFMLLFPIRQSASTPKFFNAPQSNNGWFYLFDILTAAPAPGPNTDFVTAKLARNRQIFDSARALGGKFYAISALPHTVSDWMMQFGANYTAFAALKQRYDPNRILTPGPGMF